MFVTLGLPILGVCAIAASGNGGGQYVWPVVLGLAVLVAAIVVFALIMRSEELARRLGRLANRLVGGLVRRFRHGEETDFVPMLVTFRTDIVDLVVRRWAAITASQLSVSLTQFTIFYVSLRGVGAPRAPRCWSRSARSPWPSSA